MRRTIGYAVTLPKVLPILKHASPILIHALPILLHWLGFRLSTPYLNTLPTRQSSQSESSITSPESNTLGNQSESSITSPESSANQNRALRHPRALGLGGGPFAALCSSRLAIVYYNTVRRPPALISSLLLLSAQRKH